MVDLSEEGLTSSENVKVPLVCAKSLLKYLFSASYGVSISADTLKQYWQHVSSCFEWGSRHPGRDSHLPLALYGDSARYTSQTGFIEKVACVVLNCPLWQPASTRASRFLLFAIRESLMTSFKDTVWPVYNFYAQQLNSLFWEGIKPTGSKEVLKFFLSELRGDWSWHCESLLLQNRWNSVNCCFKCPATGRGGSPFTWHAEYNEGAGWIGQEFSHVRFLNSMLKPGPVCNTFALCFESCCVFCLEIY